MPDSLADARGRRSRKTSRTQATYQGTDARGTAPRMNPRSTVPGVVADACGIAPRKTSRPVGRGRRPRGRRPNRRRSLNYVRPSLPRLSPDSTGIDGEIALLRSLTNRLLSTRPLDYTQINRCLRLIIRAYSAQAKAPKQLTDEEQIDNLIKKVVQKSVDDGEIGIFDLLPVRKAKPGDKWWPWRDLIPLRTRREYGLIDPDDPWPHEDEEYFAAMDALDKDEYDYLLDDDEDEDDDPDDDEDPPYNHTPDDDEYPPNLTVIPDPLSVIPMRRCGGRNPSLRNNHPQPRNSPRPLPRAPLHSHPGRRPELLGNRLLLLPRRPDRSVARPGRPQPPTPHRPRPPPSLTPRQAPTRTEAPSSGSPRISRLSAPGSSPCPA